MTQNKKSSLKGFILVLLAATCWATLPIFSTIAYQAGSDPLTAAAWRSYIAAAIFLIWFLCDGTIRKFRRKHLLYFLGMGIVSIGGTFILYMKAVEMLGTSMAAILNYTMPAFVILLNRLLFREKVTRIKRLSLLATFVGAALVVRAYDAGSLDGKWLGILVGLASGLTYSLTTVFGSRLPEVDGRSRAGFLIMFSPAAFLAVRPPWTLAAPSGSMLFAYLGLAVVGSVLAYILYMKGLDTGLDSGIASITATVEPAIATVLSILVFGDPLEWPQAVGILIVLAGISLPQIAAMRTRRQA